MRVDELLREIQAKHTGSKTTFIGIDGCGGAGKTTLAAKLQELDRTIAVVHMDEFDLPFAKRLPLPPEKKPIGADSEWERLIHEVFLPLQKGMKASFATYSWDLDTMYGRKTIEPFRIVIVEGVYAIRKELAEFYSLKIWIETPREIRLERGLKRDGDNARDRWLKDWMPMEDRYVQLHRPNAYADIVLAGA